MTMVFLPDIHQQEIPAALTVPEITKTMAILNTILLNMLILKTNRETTKLMPCKM